MGRRALAWLDRLENGVMATLALALVLGAATQVVLRLFDYGLIWLDPMLRVLVMWLAMFGALAAARHDRHINLDALTRMLSGNALRAARAATFLFTAGICLVLARASWGLVALDRESGTMIVDGVPAWWTQLVLPAGFVLLALRFCFRAFAKPPMPPEPGSAGGPA